MNYYVVEVAWNDERSIAQEIRCIVKADGPMHAMQRYFSEHAFDNGRDYTRLVVKKTDYIIGDVFK